MKLLDTNICIAALNGSDRKVAKNLRAPGDEFCLCSVVKAELLFGARQSASVAQNLMALERLFAVLPSLPFDDDAAAQYGVIRAQLKRAGTPIGPNDLMIAAIALTADATVVTRNIDEFSRVAGLRTETW